MALYLENIKSKTNSSLAELSEKIGISESELENISKQDEVADHVIMIVADKTGLDVEDIDTEYQSVIEKKNAIVKHLNDIERSEVLGKIKRTELIEDIQKDVKRGLRESKQDLEDFWSDYFTRDHIIEMLNSKKLFNTPKTRKYINDLVIEEVNYFINSCLEEKSSRIFERENKLVEAYPEIGFEDTDVSDGQNKPIKNVMNTRVLIPFGRTVQKNGIRIAVDVLTIGMGEIFFSGKAVIDWKNELADNVVEKYTYGDIRGKIEREIQRYWITVKDVILEHQSDLEDSWQKQFALMKKVVNEEQYVVLKHLIKQLEKAEE